VKKIVAIAMVSIVALKSSAQNVGIGTASPLMKLHVAKTDSAVALFENTQALNSNVSNALYFKTGAGNTPYTGAVKTIGESSSAARVGLFTSAASNPNGLLERMSITNIGDVGIGTTTPLTKLHIKASDEDVVLLDNMQSLNTGIKNALYFKTGSSLYSFTGAVKTIGQNGSEARLVFFTFASSNKAGLLERLTVSDNGNVGVGTTSPTAKLEVAGNVKISGGLTVGGGVVLPIKVVTADYVVQSNDYTVVVNMQKNWNIDVKIYLPVATAGRIINVVGINLPNRYITSPYGPSNRPKGNIAFVNTDGSSLPYYNNLSYSSGQMEYELSATIKTKFAVYSSRSNITFQYVDAVIGWVNIIQSNDSYDDSDTHYN